MLRHQTETEFQFQLSQKWTPEPVNQSHLINTSWILFLVDPCYNPKR